MNNPGLALLGRDAAAQNRAMAHPAIEPVIDNLVFEGGGVLGATYAGAVEVLEERGVLQRARRVAGTSAGAITATLLAAGADARRFREIVMGTDFGSFLDGR